MLKRKEMYLGFRTTILQQSATVTDQLLTLLMSISIHQGLDNIEKFTIGPKSDVSQIANVDKIK